MGVGYQFEAEFSQDLSPEQKAEIAAFFEDSGVYVNVELNPDFIYSEWVYTSYSTVDDIDKWLDDFVSRHNLAARYDWKMDDDPYLSWLGKGTDLAVLQSHYARNKILEVVHMLTEYEDVQAVMKAIRSNLIFK